jgi:hypothetical protein
VLGLFSKVGRLVGRKEKFGRISAEKVGARLASPQPRPAIAGQWGRGDNRLRDDAPAKRSFQRPRAFFQVFVATFFSWPDEKPRNLCGFDRVNDPPTGHGPRDKKCQGSQPA